MVVSESASLDRVFETLSDGQRRRMLIYLSESSDGTATVEELVELLGDDPYRTETRLRHVHLPRLKATSAVDYDDRTETIRYRGGPLLERMIDCCPREPCSPSE